MKNDEYIVDRCFDVNLSSVWLPCYQHLSGVTLGNHVIDLEKRCLNIVCERFSNHTECAQYFPQCQSSSQSSLRLLVLLVVSAVLVLIAVIVVIVYCYCKSRRHRSRNLVNKFYSVSSDDYLVDDDDFETSLIPSINQSMTNTVSLSAVSKLDNGSLILHGVQSYDTTALGEEGLVKHTV